MTGRGRHMDLGGQFASRFASPYKQIRYLLSSICLTAILPPPLCRHQRLVFLALAPLPSINLSPLYPRILMEPWCRLDILHARMEGLIKHGLLPMRTEALEWVVPSDEEVPAPPDGYVVSFTPLPRVWACGSPIDSSEGCRIIIRLSCST
jgi:hypothetical protein